MRTNNFYSKKTNVNRRPTYETKTNVHFKNRMNEGTYVGDIINEEEIEGKGYYVVRINGRVQKLAKEAFIITRKDK
jgi:hypothetical protein